MCTRNGIRKHGQDLEGMVKAVWAVLYYSVSTDQEPQHHCCPDGADSWCKYNHALANGQPTPQHNPKFPAELLPFVLPVWSDLCDEELLKKSVRHYPEQK